VTDSARARVWLRYTARGVEPVVLELYGDPFEVCRRAAEKLGLTIIEPDPGHDAVMRERVLRAQRERKVA
jgi:hypothetical protein